MLVSEIVKSQFTGEPCNQLLHTELQIGAGRLSIGELTRQREIRDTTGGVQRAMAERRPCLTYNCSAALPEDQRQGK